MKTQIAYSAGTSGRESNRVEPAIRVTDAVKATTTLDLIVSDIYGYEDLTRPGYVGAPCALHIKGRAEPLLVSETRREIYELVDAAGVSLKIASPSR